ncbi:hypothetical protein FOZ62_000843 [Perkinsus olseni]|uniref:Uncharacterized protein n=1 Tax=Perkinsus olseni TaxID=32597 RepID=A0A7J6RNT2_PEROL|nr:hypothetical protein FOZ62_000843 [Perkinsus olseni]
MLNIIVVAMMVAAQSGGALARSSASSRPGTPERLPLEPPNLGIEALFARLGSSGDKWLIETAYRRLQSRFVVFTRWSTGHASAERLTLSCEEALAVSVPEETVDEAACSSPDQGLPLKSTLGFYFGNHVEAMTFANVWGNYRNFHTPWALATDVPVYAAGRQKRKNWEELLEENKVKFAETNDEVGGLVTARCIPEGGAAGDAVLLTFHFETVEDAHKFEGKWGGPLPARSSAPPKLVLPYSSEDLSEEVSALTAARSKVGIEW